MSRILLLSQKVSTTASVQSVVSSYLITRPFQEKYSPAGPECCQSCCRVFSFLPFIPSELVHWATKHLSRVLNSNNPNLIFSPWLSLVTPETADQWDDCCGSLVKNTTNEDPGPGWISRQAGARCGGCGEDRQVAEVWSSPCLWLGRLA